MPGLGDGSWPLGAPSTAFLAHVCSPARRAALERGDRGTPPRPGLSLMLQGCENPRALVSCWGEAGRETPASRMDPIRGRATNQPGTILVVVTTNGTRAAPTRHRSSWGGEWRGLSPPAGVGGCEEPILLMRHWPKLHKIPPHPSYSSRELGTTSGLSDGVYGSNRMSKIGFIGWFVTARPREGD